MSRKVNLWYNLNVTYRSIGYDLAYLLLRVVAAILFVPLAERSRYRRVATAEATNLRKFGVRLYLYAPTLIIGQVPM